MPGIIAFAQGCCTSLRSRNAARSPGEDFAQSNYGIPCVRGCLVSRIQVKRILRMNSILRQGRANVTVPLLNLWCSGRFHQEPRNQPSYDFMDSGDEGRSIFPRSYTPIISWFLFSLQAFQILRHCTSEVLEFALGPALAPLSRHVCRWLSLSQMLTYSDIRNLVES